MLLRSTDFNFNNSTGWEQVKEQLGTKALGKKCAWFAGGRAIRSELLELFELRGELLWVSEGLG